MSSTRLLGGQCCLVGQYTTCSDTESQWLSPWGWHLWFSLKWFNNYWMTRHFVQTFMLPPRKHVFDDFLIIFSSSTAMRSRHSFQLESHFSFHVIETQMSLNNMYSKPLFFFVFSKRILFLHGDHLEYSNQWSVEFLQFISELINTYSLVGANAYKNKGLFNHNPAILVFS